ncbi:RidA family protein [Nocardia sp. NPDC051321]|uniref:RidA family protein n=1 Tax=Nocardia sp. NPDC051321 TaxID=3364323 RepID=UPI0037A7CFF7
MTISTYEGGTLETKESGRVVVFSPSIWEPQMGYSRGVRQGNHVYVAGTVATDGDGAVQGEGAYEQTQFILSKIEATLLQLGSCLEDVVSTTTHLRDFLHFDAYSEAFKSRFAEITPVNTTIRAELVKRELLVEISAIAIVGG